MSQRSQDTREGARELAAALADERDLLLVVTGAGISLASGIPTFRGTDPGAIWKHDLTELATFAYFSRDPVGSWKWYLDRFHLVGDARPNAAHRALAALEDWQTGRDGDWLLVTQNVDTLHEQAGSHRLVKVHGSADRVRCSAQGCRLAAPRGVLSFSEADAEIFMASPSLATLPRCPECEAPLRPHVLWFDEYYGDHDDYQWERVVAAALTTRLVLFVGTSFSVGVTDMILQQTLSTNARIISVEPGGHRVPDRRVLGIREKAEELLPAVCAELAIDHG